MNYSTAILLINDNARAIRCSYEPDKHGGTPSSYLFKTFDPTIKAGDFVVVPTDTRWKMTVNRVEEVDCAVDFDSSLEIKWIISKFDVSDAAKIAEEEAKAIEIIKKAEAKDKRDKLKASVSAFHDEQLKTLQITHMGNVEEAK